MSSARPLKLDTFDAPVRIPTRRFERGKFGLYASPLHRMGRLWRRYTTNPRLLRASCERIPVILGSIPPVPGLPDPTAWVVIHAHWTITDVAVIAVGPVAEPPAAFVKLPASEEGLESVRRQAEVLSILHADSGRMADLAHFLPVPLAQGDIAGQGWIAERALPGVELRSLLPNGDLYTAGIRASAALVAALHRQTLQETDVTDSMLHRWIDAPLLVMQQLAESLPQPRRYGPMIESMRRELHDALRGGTVQTSWIHGDYWPSNVLVSPEGVVLGIVDWERAAPVELPLHDLLHLVLHSARLEAQHRDLGATVRAVLSGESLSDDEMEMLQMSPLPFEPTREGVRLMLMLYWLRYVATYLAKVPDQARNQWWVRRNVGAVLKSL